MSIAWSVSADRLKRLVLEQPLREVGARILRGLPGRARQEHLRLDVDELGRHGDVLRRDVEVELAHRVEVRGVLLRDVGDRDVGDRHLVDADEMEEEVEGTREGRDGDGGSAEEEGGSAIRARGREP